MSIYIRMTTPFIYFWFSQTDTDTDTEINFTILLVTDTLCLFGPDVILSPRYISFCLAAGPKHNHKPTFTIAFICNFGPCISQAQMAVMLFFLLRCMSHEAKTNSFANVLYTRFTSWFPSSLTQTYHLPMILYHATRSHQYEPSNRCTKALTT